MCVRRAVQGMSRVHRRDIMHFPDAAVIAEIMRDWPAIPGSRKARVDSGVCHRSFRNESRDIRLQAVTSPTQIFHETKVGSPHFYFSIIILHSILLFPVFKLFLFLCKEA